MGGTGGGAEEAVGSSFFGSDFCFRLFASDLRIPGDFDCKGEGGPGCSMLSNDALATAVLEGVALPVGF